MGTARMPTVQISNSVRATGDSPCASYQAPAVTASHSISPRCRPGRFDGNLGGQHVEPAQHQLEFLQFRGESGVKLVLPQHTRADELI